jgi:antitoxin FitA
MLMGSLSVRNLDDELLAKLKRRAARHARSAEAEVRDILRLVLSSEADIDFDVLASELRALTAGRRHTPAEDLVREGRDER